MAKQQAKIQKKSSHASWMLIQMQGLIIFSFAVILFLSLIGFAIRPDAKNFLGLLGHTLGWSFHALFGISSYLIAIYIGWIGWRHLFNKTVNHPILKTLYASMAILSTCMLLSVIECQSPAFGDLVNQILYPGLWAKKQHYHLGGALFFYFYCDFPYFNLHRMLNVTGVLLIFSTTLIASLLFLFKIQLAACARRFMESIQNEKDTLPAFAESIVKQITIPEKSEEKESALLRFVKLRIPSSTIQDQTQKITQETPNDMLGIQPEKDLKIRPSITRKEQADELLDEEDPAPIAPPPTPEPIKRPKREAALVSQSIHNGDFTKYVLPSVDFLTNPKKVDQSSLKKDLKRRAEVLEETLLSFGIEAKVGQINCGPTITSFEVHPAIGVKVQKIKTLDNDIALNMEAKSIRIIAPIPGKAAVGIEVPNPQPQEVGFKDMLMAYQQGPQKFHIPILLGKAVNGDYVMSDLTKMPHCIIAGATGSGKSVCINTIVMSIVMNAKPDRIKLVMVDPKKVELTPYSKLPHMLAPVITEPLGAAAALKWLVREMETRYDILKLVGVRNIEAFNNRKIDAEAEAKLGREIPTFLPFIVGIIDELADLMMVASSDIETPIARIAQMARAVGIHLILATQRPSREVITGLIKANFPTRISFKVASRVNSQIVLDETGAESLLGNGDMLFLPPGSSHLVRAQGAFIRDEDIQAVVRHINAQAPTNYVIESFDQYVSIDDNSSSKSKDMELDSLYMQAKEIILGTGNASTTFLQRKLKVGYARAASLMDQLEANGIVGPADGSKPRKIYGNKQGDEPFLDGLEEEFR